MTTKYCYNIFTMNKFEKPFDQNEGKELFRKMREAQEQGKSIEHLGFEIDESTGEYVRIKSKASAESVSNSELIPNTQEKPKEEKKIYRKATIAKCLEPSDEVPKGWLTRQENDPRDPRNQ